ncbi:hypothetical protein SAMN04515647_1823 [Cohaesibacter sp. ES.047]|nr:hypothetical protein SAMN04515647_1823 [Cohaesibacter sp. ES.047]
MTSRNVPDIRQKHPDNVMTNVMPRTKQSLGWANGVEKVAIEVIAWSCFNPFKKRRDLQMPLSDASIACRPMDGTEASCAGSTLL